jgi:peptidoglycan-N-acetylglucosamine deacetylase
MDMKRVKFIFLFVILVMAGISGFSQKVDSPYQVGTWSGFRTAAICFTFDDEYPYQLSIAVPEFNKYNFKLTMFVITTPSWNPTANWTGLQSAVEEGHEVGSHTVTHPYLNKLTVDQEIAELRDSKATIEGHFPGYKCLTTAYPYCQKGRDTICNKYYIAARACPGSIDPSTPTSLMYISSIICGSLGRNTTKAFKADFNNVAKTKGLLTYLSHGLDDDGSYSPLSSMVLKNTLNYLSYRRSKYWVTTFGSAARYIKERNAANVTQTSDQDTLKTFTVTDNLNDSIFNFPLTIRRPLPDDWPSATVIQDTLAVPTRIVKVDTVVYITFDVVPDAGEVKIIKSNAVVEPAVDVIPPDSIPKDSLVAPVAIKQLGNEGSAVEFKAWVVNNNLKFLVPPTSGSDLIVSIYDLKGVSVFTRRIAKGMDGISNVVLPKFKSGGYILSVSDGRTYWSKQFYIV